MKLKPLFCNFLLATILLLQIPAYCGQHDGTSQQSLPSSPLVFIENKGQVTDQFGKTRPDVDFALHTNAMNVFIGSDGLHYMWSSTNVENKNNTDAYRLDVLLYGADINAVAIPEQQDTYYERYYLPQTPEGAIAHSYKKITYRNIYPNIDWLIYTSGNNLKYDFIVRPGGNPADIRLSYLGATQLVMLDGAVVANTPFGKITEQKPYSYDAITKSEIPSSFILDKNVLSFNIAPQSNTIVIDPVLNWATYCGDPSNTIIVKINADAFGNVYAYGQTANANFSTFGAHQGTYAGNKDCFIMKLNKGGGREWATYYGSSGEDVPTAMVGDLAGNLYVAGYTPDQGHVFANIGSHQYTNGGNGLNGQTLIDGFVAKFTSAGGRVWGSFYGGIFNDFAQAIALDDSGNVIIGGYSESPGSIATTGTHQATFGGVVMGQDNEGFVAKFSNSGVRQWGSYYKGRVYAVTADREENIYLGGFCTPFTSNLSTSGAHQLSYGGGATDAFAAKFNSTGSRLWGTFYGGNADDEIYAMATDSLNNLYLGGWTTSPGGIATSGTYQPSLAPPSPQGQNYDGMIIKMSSSGVRQWGTYYGVTYQEAIKDIQVSTDGYIYCAGFYQLGLTDIAALVTKFNTGGQRQWHTLFTGPANETNTSVGICHGKMYIGGLTTSSTDIATPGSFQSSKNTPDPLGYIAQFEADTNVFLNLAFTDTLLCAGDSSYLDYHTTNRYGPNNVFTVQLSNATGSFAAPVNVGTKTFDSSGYIKYIIPANTPQGTGYRLRVVSSAFADTTRNNGVNIRISAFPNVGPVAIYPVCANGTLQLMDTATNVPIGTTHKWTGPGNFNVGTATYNRPNVQISDTGYYVLTADNYGCVSTDSIHVMIYPKPAKPVITTTSPVCSGDTLAINMLSSTQGVTGYNLTQIQSGTPVWYAAEMGGDTVIPAATLADSGTYVAVAVYNGCISDAETTKVVINPSATPTVQIGAIPPTAGPWQSMTLNVVGFSFEGANPAYQWTKNGTDIQGATTTSYTGTTGIDFQTGDTICVVMTSSYACASPLVVKSCLGIEIDLGVDDINKATGVHFYPNPTHGTIMIETLKDGFLQIANVHGQSIVSYKLSSGKNNISLPAGIAAGTYIGRLTTSDAQTTVFRILYTAGN